MNNSHDVVITEVIVVVITEVIVQEIEDMGMGLHKKHFYIYQ